MKLFREKLNPIKSKCLFMRWDSDTGTWTSIAEIEKIEGTNLFIDLLLFFKDEDNYNIIDKDTDEHSRQHYLIKFGNNLNTTMEFEGKLISGRIIRYKELVEITIELIHDIIFNSE